MIFHCVLKIRKLLSLEFQQAKIGRALFLVLFATACTTFARVEFTGVFAPQDGWVKPVEKPFRAELCLNGSWQFQPVSVPASFKRGAGEPPELPLPKADGWEPTPIKIPSPWNVNTWGCGRNVGPGTDRPYWPDSVYFPSYPAAWDHVEMGWLRRTFSIPSGWSGRRLVLHFEAVAGECQVWVNGQQAGAHFDKYLPFDLDVTKLCREDRPNELLVGVRAYSLFEKRSARYPKMRAPFPTGSETERLAGIWQDVFLSGVPPVRVTETFIKPLVDQDVLETELTIRNDGERQETVRVDGEVLPWVNLAGTNVIEAPGPKWRLGPSVLSINATTVTVRAGESVKVLLRERVAGRLKLWAPGSPNLYATVLSVRKNDEVLDRHSTRFGWRQFSINGSDLFLNGKKIQLVGDLLHPFGPYTLSRSYAWAWYRLIQDFGGNAVRPHAQPHPRHYMELADEMGLVVLDETALFGSSIALNFEEPVAWERFAGHYDGLVQRDRNNPSVLGWSFGNELFAIFDLNNVSKEDADGWYRRLAELGARARTLDPTRSWISCDGDEDLRGALPVWSKHFGHGTPLDRLPGNATAGGDARPPVNKPLMVGESGGTYYARPKQLAVFNGSRAYASYEGRNEALAIDVFDNIVRMARPRLAYYSASETAWFGVEHLGYGYRDFTRLPGKGDGIFFTRPFQENTPGIQPERLPPYVATLNPGWDSALPLYKPLAMFEAQKAALAKKVSPAGSPLAPHTSNLPRPASHLTHVGFVGKLDGPLATRLAALGLPLTNSAQAFTIVDGEALSASVAAAKAALATARASGGIVLLMLDRANPPADLLPAGVRLTERAATALVPDERHPWTAAFELSDLYFAEDGADRFIQRRGMEGPLVENGRVLLRASDTDWSLFNNAPENAKCAALVLYEHLVKPSGAALVESTLGSGKLVVSSLDYNVASTATARFWRHLFANMGVKLNEPRNAGTPAFDDKGALVNALAAGRFAGADVDSALARDFLEEATVHPTNGARAGAFQWQPVVSPSHDRFLFHDLKQRGPESGPFAVYFSFWVKSPRALDDLLAGGPDAPHLTMLSFAAEKCRVFLNGREVTPARTSPADYRTLSVFENLPLKKDWNHFLIKVAAGDLRGEHPGTLAVRISSNNQEYLRQLETAIER